MNKYSTDQHRRRDEILRIIRSEEVHSQEDLQALLSERGLEATQPTLSRDLRELGVAKTPNGYAVLSAASSGDAPVITMLTPATREHRLHQALAEFAVSVEVAGNLIVVRTTIGGAQPLALAIDNAALPNMVGSIGGDDTIFLAIRTAAAARRMAKELRESFASPRRERRARA